MDDLYWPSWYEYGTPLEDFPLGAVMVRDYPRSQDERQSLRYETSLRPPWVPLVLKIPPGGMDTAEELVGALQVLSKAGVIPLEWGKQSQPDRAELERALHERPAPSATTMTIWLAERLGDQNLFAIIRASMIQRGYIFSNRSLHRRVKEQLHCRPSDLRRLARLVRLPRLRSTVDNLAAAAGTTPTRLRERVKAGLGMSLAEFNRVACWEWVLEAAVRAGLGAGGWGLGEGNHCAEFHQQADNLSRPLEPVEGALGLAERSRP